MNWERDERMSSPSLEFIKQKAPVARRMKRDGHSRIRLLSNQNMLHFSRLAIFDDHVCMSKERITLLDIIGLLCLHMTSFFTFT
jgi:hypothetical protein